MAMFLMCEPLRGTLTQAADDFRIIRNTYEYISVRFGGGGGLLTHYHPHPPPPNLQICQDSGSDVFNLWVWFLMGSYYLD